MQFLQNAILILLIVLAKESTALKNKDFFACLELDVN
jgi:hypothetical protein